jgi:PmbA protein
MLEPSAAQERCAALIDLAKRSGADAADALAGGNTSETVEVRLGKLENVERSENEEIGLRVFVGKRSASIQSTDCSDAALAEMAERAVAMAKTAPEDQYAGLAPEELLAKGPFADFDQQDPDEPSPQELRSRAEAAEDAARAVKGVTNSEGGGASFSQNAFALVTSHGFAGTRSSTAHGLSAVVIAGEGGNMQRDYAWRSAHHLEDLLAPEEIGQLAGDRAVARLNPGSMPSKPVPVVFDPRVSHTLLGHIVGAMAGPSAARKTTFLLDRIDEELFDPAIRILDDPHRLRGPKSRPFDGEGLPTAPRALVENGRVTGWLTNAASAKQLGIGLTGHASRGGAASPGVSTSNVHCDAGPVSRAELIADIEDGVLVTELIGMGVNNVTGDYSRGASGFRIRNGEIVGPVAEITVAGNLLKMFKEMRVADDLDMHRAMNAPTIRVDGMTVAGE